MGYLKYIRQLWKKPSETLSELMKERLIQWRREPVTVRINKPTRIDRARSLGYKAKKGFVVVRQRVSRSKRMRPMIKHGRRTKHNRQFLSLDKNYQQVAEERAGKKYPNCEVLNSYKVGEDGKNYWFEIILVEWSNPSIVADKTIGWMGNQRGRVHRGLTSSGKKARGLRHKGTGTEKNRPSKSASFRRKHSRKARKA